MSHPAWLWLFNCSKTWQTALTLDPLSDNRSAEQPGFLQKDLYMFTRPKPVSGPEMQHSTVRRKQRLKPSPMLALFRVSTGMLRAVSHSPAAIWLCSRHSSCMGSRISGGRYCMKAVCR